jgi:hypothetical protein
MILRQFFAFALASLQFSPIATGFTSKKVHRKVLGNKPTVHMSNKNISPDAAAGSTANPSGLHPSELPGDPSLVLVTNLDLGDKKLGVMKKCSKAISEATGKPEAYIGVTITDNASVLFGYVQCKRVLVLYFSWSRTC